MLLVRSLMLAAALALPVLLPSEAAAMTTASMPALGKLAMVDLQRILNETNEGKRSKKKLESELKSRQQKLDKTRARLESEAAKLGSLKGAALQQAQEKLQRESVQWQQDAMSFEAELAQQENTMLEKIYGNVQSIVVQIAKEQSLDMILVRDQMTVIYAEDTLDITDEVIRRYDKVHK